jgi:hypothetical protein
MQSAIVITCELRDQSENLMEFYTIKEAIRTAQRLKLTLAEGECLVEPHVLGRSRGGKTLLRAFQVHGPDRATNSGSWKMFDLERIHHAVEANERFQNPRPGYRPNDPAMNGGILERL